MKIHRKMRHVGERRPAGRRPLGFRAMCDLLARRQRLRKRIGLAVAMFLSAGLLLAEFEA